MALSVPSTGQLGDYAGPNASVGPDGIKDIDIKLDGVSTASVIDHVRVTRTGPSPVYWESGSNPNGYANAEVVFYPSNGETHVYINPTQGVALGSPTFTLTSGSPMSVEVFYKDGSTGGPATFSAPTIDTKSITVANSTSVPWNATATATMSRPESPGRHRRQVQALQSRSIRRSAALGTLQWACADRPGRIDLGV